MYSAAGDTTSLVPGFPIRTSSDQRSVDSSPRHIAASHVLHRPLMPRHPPCALNNLTTTNTTQNQGTNPPQRGGLSTVRCQEHNKNKDARIHYTILKHQPNNPPTSHLPPQPAERYEPRRIPDQKHHPT